ncbi:MAG: hypothetical protein AAF234_12620 [Pseudomonadota bacterium]
MEGTPRLLWLLFALWAIAFAGSFIAYAMIEPTGSSFTRGMNRASAFLGWQAAAIGFAVVLWWRARRLILARGTRWLMRMPILIALGLLAAFFIFVAWGVWAGGSGVL